MQGINFTLKITVDSIEELKRVFEEIRQIEKSTAVTVLNLI